MLAPDGTAVPFRFVGYFEDGPISLGWLRASHRELDERRSTPAQPWHTHLREQRLKPGEVVPVDIEIMPGATVFHAGESLRVVIQGHDHRTGSGEATHRPLRNRGEHVIHTGGPHDSRVVVTLGEPGSTSR